MIKLSGILAEDFQQKTNDNEFRELFICENYNLTFHYSVNNGFLFFKFNIFEYKNQLVILQKYKIHLLSDINYRKQLFSNLEIFVNRLDYIFEGFIFLYPNKFFKYII